MWLSDIENSILELFSWRAFDVTLNVLFFLFGSHSSASARFLPPPPAVSGGHHGDHSDRHHPLRSLLFPRPLRLQRVPLQCGDGHPQPAAQTRVLLLRVPDVPRAGGRVQRQLW